MAECQTCNQYELGFTALESHIGRVCNGEVNFEYLNAILQLVNLGRAWLEHVSWHLGGTPVEWRHDD